jgi:hypothetical protein
LTGGRTSYPVEIPHHVNDPPTLLLWRIDDLADFTLSELKKPLASTGLAGNFEFHVRGYSDLLSSSYLRYGRFDLIDIIIFLYFSTNPGILRIDAQLDIALANQLSHTVGAYWKAIARKTARRKPQFRTYFQ